MPKKPKARIAELKYIKRARKLAPERPKRTPWMEFFRTGPGAEVETLIPKTSIRSIVYSYGVRLGKKFVCSYTEHDELTLVRLESVEERDN